MPVQFTRCSLLTSADLPTTASALGRAWEANRLRKRFGDVVETGEFCYQLAVAGNVVQFQLRPDGRLTLVHAAVLETMTSQPKLFLVIPTGRRRVHADGLLLDLLAKLTDRLHAAGHTAELDAQKNDSLPPRISRTLSRAPQHADPSADRAPDAPAGLWADVPWVDRQGTLRGGSNPHPAPAHRRTTRQPSPPEAAIIRPRSGDDDTERSSPPGALEPSGALVAEALTRLRSAAMPLEVFQVRRAAPVEGYWVGTRRVPVPGLRPGEMYLAEQAVFLNEAGRLFIVTDGPTHRGRPTYLAETFNPSSEQPFDGDSTGTQFLDDCLRELFSEAD